MYTHTHIIYAHCAPLQHPDTRTDCTYSCINPSFGGAKRFLRSRKGDVHLRV